MGTQSTWGRTSRSPCPCCLTTSTSSESRCVASGGGGHGFGRRQEDCRSRVFGGCPKIQPAGAFVAAGILHTYLGVRQRFAPAESIPCDSLGCVSVQGCFPGRASV